MLRNFSEWDLVEKDTIINFVGIREKMENRKGFNIRDNSSLQLVDRNAVAATKRLQPGLKLRTPERPANPDTSQFYRVPRNLSAGYLRKRH